MSKLLPIGTELQAQRYRVEQQLSSGGFGNTYAIIMQGTGATFHMKNGDVFTGEFRDDRFHNGRYTVKDDGSYFEGSFKNGQPDQGSWYDKNGKRL